MDSKPGYDKPLPRLTALNKPFWEGTVRGELLLQRCQECGKPWYPIEPRCPKCLSPAYEWTRSNGRATVLSHVVFHQVYDVRFKESVPYNVALVELEEDVRMFTNIVGIPDQEIRVGMRVEVVFDRVTADVAIPRFRPSLTDGEALSSTP